jgi:hypothetical protein
MRSVRVRTEYHCSISFLTFISQTPDTPVRGPIQRPVFESTDSFGDTRSEESDETDETDGETDESFARDHLSDITLPRDALWSVRCEYLLGTIRATGCMYPALCELLNLISQAIYGKLFFFLREPIR